MLRHHQQLAQQGHGSAGSISRGRGTARNSVPSSRAASAASSQSQAPRLMIDVTSLNLLQRHFEHVMTTIQRRIDVLEQNANASLASSQAFLARSHAAADAEIARFKRINEEMDKLDAEFDTIEKIRAVVGKVAERVRAVSQRVDSGGSSAAQSRRR